MSLSFEKYWEIAEALNEAHPTQPLLNLEEGKLYEMIKALPDFDDDTAPTSGDLHSVWVSWTDLAYPEEAEKIPSSIM